MRTIALVALVLVGCGGAELAEEETAALDAARLFEPHAPAPSCPAGLEWGIGVFPVACDEPGAERLNPESTPTCGALLVVCSHPVTEETQVAYRLVGGAWVVD